MIIDKIGNANLYGNIFKGFKKALKYLINTDFNELANGTYNIDGDDIFAIVQEYNTKDKSEAKLEAHKKYIDIQYIHSGKEHIGVDILKDQTIVINEPENDIAFYEGEASFVKLRKEMFAVFFPHDLHMPGIMVSQSEKVKKVVIKIKV